MPGMLLSEGKSRGTQSGQRSLRWKWNDKRPTWHFCRPERAESAVLLPLFSSYAAVVLKRPVRYPRSNRIAGNAKQVNRSAGVPKW